MTRPKKNSPAQKSKSNPTMPSAAENPMHSFLEDVAVIEVHAVGFRDVFTARGTGPKHRGSDYRLAMPRWHPGVTLKGKSTVVVTGGPVTIAFYFPGDSYFPAGITFVLKSRGLSGSVEEKLGHTNFPPADIRLEKHAVVIRDTYGEKDATYRYKFSMVIQDATGAVGIIDPIIIHDPI